MKFFKLFKLIIIWIVLSMALCFNACCVINKNKAKTFKTVDEILVDETESLYGDYEDILSQPNPEKILKEILTRLPEVGNRFDVYANLQLALAIETLEKFSEKHNLSEDLVPILLTSLDRQPFFPATYYTAKLLTKITKIDVGWDEKFANTWEDTEQGKLNIIRKKMKWQDWLENKSSTQIK